MIEVEERIFTDAYKEVRNHKDYPKLLDKLAEIENLIIQLTGSSRLIAECESIIGMINNIHLEITCNFGRKDKGEDPGQ